ITESPMNFWTVPPQASIVEVITEKNRWRRTRQRSGSKRSPRVVDPVMSAKRTVTSLRSSSARSPTAAPQAGQKRAPAGTAAEQRGHARSTPTNEAYTGRPRNEDRTAELHIHAAIYHPEGRHRSICLPGYR